MKAIHNLFRLGAERYIDKGTFEVFFTLTKVGTILRGKIYIFLQVLHILCDCLKSQKLISDDV